MSDFEPRKRTIFKWWAIGLTLAVLTSSVLAILSYAGIIFQTVVERKAYEQSYQYQAGRREQRNILQAQLAEIETQLLDPKLPAETRQQLRAQQAAIRVRLRAAQR